MSSPTDSPLIKPQSQEPVATWSKANDEQQQQHPQQRNLPEGSQQAERAEQWSESSKKPKVEHRNVLEQTLERLGQTEEANAMQWGNTANKPREQKRGTLDQGHARLPQIGSRPESNKSVGLQSGSNDNQKATAIDQGVQRQLSEHGGSDLAESALPDIRSDRAIESDKKDVEGKVDESQTANIDWSADWATKSEDSNRIGQAQKFEKGNNFFDTLGGASSIEHAASRDIESKTSKLHVKQTAAQADDNNLNKAKIPQQASSSKKSSIEKQSSNKKQNAGKAKQDEFAGVDVGDDMSAPGKKDQQEPQSASFSSPQSSSSSVDQQSASKQAIGATSAAEEDKHSSDLTPLAKQDIGKSSSSSMKQNDDSAPKSMLASGWSSDDKRKQKSPQSSSADQQSASKQAIGATSAAEEDKQSRDLTPLAKQDIGKSSSSSMKQNDDSGTDTSIHHKSFAQWSGIVTTVVHAVAILTAPLSKIVSSKQSSSNAQDSSLMQDQIGDKDNDLLDLDEKLRMPDKDASVKQDKPGKLNKQVGSIKQDKSMKRDQSIKQQDESGQFKDHVDRPSDQEESDDIIDQKSKSNMTNEAGINASVSVEGMKGVDVNDNDYDKSKLDENVMQKQGLQFEKGNRQQQEQQRQQSRPVQQPVQQDDDAIDDTGDVGEEETGRQVHPAQAQIQLRHRGGMSIIADVEHTGSKVKEAVKLAHKFEGESHKKGNHAHTKQAHQPSNQNLAATSSREAGQQSNEIQ